jgi:hypothetical protein
MLCVYAGQVCLGFILSRGKLGHEAFDWRDKSIGIYPSVKAAAAAVMSAEAVS